MSVKIVSMSLSKKQLNRTNEYKIFFILMIHLKFFHIADDKK